MNHVVAKKEE